MGDVTIDPPVFARGSTVLDYWLVHAEGLTVEPLGARVEEVVLAPREGRAEQLIVRSRRTHRRRTIDAEAIAAVEPAAGTLLLDGAEERDSRPRVGREHLARAAAWTRPRAARTGAAVALGSRTAAAWARPRAKRTAIATARYGRSAGKHTATGIRWLAPRVAASTRSVAATVGSLVAAAVVVTARATAYAARSIEDAADRRRRNTIE